jgi:predicted SAM-dependent methyltransferase
MFNLDVFVETGTYLGDSALTASKMFKEVHTIELSEKLYRNALERLRQSPNIICHLGDSTEVMPQIIPSLNGRVLFWLDGHYSGGITSRGTNNTPVLRELEAIRLLPSAEAVILIDDLRLFQDTKPGFQTASSLDGYPTITALKQAIEKHFPAHQFFVYGDIAIILTGRLSCNVSPVIEGMTTSRLWNEELGPSYELTKAERAIISAQGDELEALNDLYHSKKIDAAYGLAGHYHLWLILTLIGKKELSSAADELRRLMDAGTINNLRLDWYDLLLTTQANSVACCQEQSYNHPSAPEVHRHSEKMSSMEDMLISEFVRLGIWQHGTPIRLHLGCGSKRLEGYLNIDFPQSEHNITTVNADYYADITALIFPKNSIDEIRLHHVFEHFSRVEALALLIRWHEWLKPGGLLELETPDIEGTARIILSDAQWNIKSASIRHIAGDQSARWGFHVDHWSADRFMNTLSKLGFNSIETNSSNWKHEPYLANVTVTAKKHLDLSRDELLAAADEILSESLVSRNEVKTHQIWRQQLREALAATKPQADEPVHASALTSLRSDLPLDEIHFFNQRTRDNWVAVKASQLPPGTKVLDVGAGTCPYRHYFAHCRYFTQDFKKYDGIKRDGGRDYGTIDYESDITRIPVEDASFDAILCTEVLEHVPDPPAALREMSRILRPGGTLLLTVPLGSGLHQLPYHFYGGLSPNWYHYWGGEYGMHVAEMVPNGGFFRLLAQECIRAASMLPKSATLTPPEKQQMGLLLSESLPRFLFAMEDEIFTDQFTVGYHVELRKNFS